MLKDSPIMAFVPVTDLDRAREFYSGVLGLAVEDVNNFACVLRGGTTMLRATLVGELRPQPFTVLGWVVTDIRRTAADLVAHGVTPHRYDGLSQDADGVWTAPGGDEVLWFPDPDGNTLSLNFREVATILGARRARSPSPCSPPSSDAPATPHLDRHNYQEVAVSNTP